MGFVKYALGQTGLFPRFEPKASDVVNVAKLVQNVENLHNARGVWYWYVSPNLWNDKNVADIKRIFWNNGVWLRSHYSYNFGNRVLRAGDFFDRPFIKNVKDFCDGTASEQDIKERINADIARHRKRFDGVREILGRHR